MDSMTDFESVGQGSTPWKGTYGNRISQFGMGNPFHRRFQLNLVRYANWMSGWSKKPVFVSSNLTRTTFQNPKLTENSARSSNGRTRHSECRCAGSIPALAADPNWKSSGWMRILFRKQVADQTACEFKSHDFRLNKW